MSARGAGEVSGGLRALLPEQVPDSMHVTGRAHRVGLRAVLRGPAAQGGRDEQFPGSVPVGAPAEGEPRAGDEHRDGGI